MAADPSNFRQMLLDSPGQFEAGFELAKDIKVEGTFESIVISGMGGSALPGNLIRVYLSDLFKKMPESGSRIGVYQNRFYSLPHESYNNSLNLMISYSGNTEETIESFQEALSNNLPCVGISSGGKIEQICKENNVPHVMLPMPFPDFQPRLGTGYIFGVVIQILINQGLIPDTKEDILSAANKLRESISGFEEKGKELARKIEGKTPVIYTSTKYKPLAMIWKIMFNENGKTPAFWNFFPELNHNEANGFVSPQGKFIAVMLRDPNDHPRNYKRFEITAQILKEYGTDTEMVDMGENDEMFYKMFSTLLLGGFTSYYIALAYGNDPTPVVLVEKFKVLLG